MMRIAVAGGGGLGYLLATELSQAEQAYNVIVLSRTARPEYAEVQVQVHVVDYHNHESLDYALRGVDMVISTVPGPEQLNLINAAGHGRVRLFVPSEFEGALSRRPSHSDPLDRGSFQALELLERWAQGDRMKYTVFSCGLFMERFHPYGLGSLSIGYGEGVSDIGDYLINVNERWADFADRSSRGSLVRVCLTSAYDVARFVVAAVELGPGTWPREFTMRGDRLALGDVVDACSRAIDTPFNTHIRPFSQIQTLIEYCISQGDNLRATYYQRIEATALGRYDFRQGSLNTAIANSRGAFFQPMTFRQWLQTMYQSS